MRKINHLDLYQQNQLKLRLYFCGYLLWVLFDELSRSLGVVLGAGHDGGHSVGHGAGAVVSDTMVSLQAFVN
jgi:hypothetical protein